MKESTVESHFVKRVRERGGIPYKFRSPQRRSVPDRIAVMPDGITLWCEIKAPDKEPRDDQLREHQRLRDRGHVVLVLDTKERVDFYFDPECRYANLSELRKLRA